MIENSEEMIDALAIQKEDEYIDDYVGEYVDYDWDAEVIHNGPSIREVVDFPLIAQLASLPSLLTANYILSPSLNKLRDGFRKIAPTSDTSSDGWIGNYAHCGGCVTCCQLLSDHCADCGGMVHAIDKDKDLRSPYGVTMQMAVKKTLDTPADRARLNYIIFNQTIWSANFNWLPRAYTGSNPHTEHAHFSGRYEDAIELDTRPWGIEEFAAPKPIELGKELEMIRVVVQGQPAVYLTNGNGVTHIDGPLNAALQNAGIPLVTVPNGNNGFIPTQSYLDQITSITSKANVSLTADQVQIIADQLSAALVANENNALGEADKPAIKSALVEVLNSVNFTA